VGHAVDFIAYDYFHRTRAVDRHLVARRTSALATRCDAKGQPAFASALGVGFPPHAPPRSGDDSAQTLLTALAYGLRGYNLFMAVERDRWIGAPVARDGRRLPAADFYERLNSALERVDWFRLRRCCPVRVVVPRTERRLARIGHAFGPVNAAVLGGMGLGPRETILEHAHRNGASVDADTFLRTLEHALDGRGVPYAVVGGDEPEFNLEGAAWVVVVTSGGFGDRLARELERSVERGVPVTLGPSERYLDERLCPLPDPWRANVEVSKRTDPRTVDELVARHVESAGIRPLANEPEGVFSTVHEDPAGQQRVAFVLNSTDHELVARVALGPDAEDESDMIWKDALDGERLRTHAGILEVRIRPQSVRMLARADEPPVTHRPGG
jgi:beta-galactosidase